MKAYLGDGVYIEDNGVDMKLTTENGIEVTNEIYLDRSVSINLIKFIQSTWDLIERLQEEGK